jgi:hypothetical protein
VTDGTPGKEEKVAAKQSNTRKPKILESITGTDALAILKVLADGNKSLAQEIDAIAKALLNHVEAGRSGTKRANGTGIPRR